MKRRHGLLLFISACIPGCGQMYQGYMKRGFSLLGAACVDLGVASLLGIGELAALLPLIWLYAFYDTYNIRAQSDQEVEQNPDGYLFGLAQADGEKLEKLLRGRHSLIGWCLVVLGCYTLFRTVLSSLFGPWLPDWLYAIIFYDLPRMVVTLLIIALGVWFIRGPKDAKGREDYHPYTPPADGSAQVETEGISRPEQAEQKEEHHGEA